RSTSLPGGNNKFSGSHDFDLQRHDQNTSLSSTDRKSFFRLGSSLPLSGANPRRKQFSVMTRGTRKFCRYSRPPALVPPPDILKPPKGWRSTTAPVTGR